MQCAKASYHPSGGILVHDIEDETVVDVAILAEVATSKIGFKLRTDVYSHGPDDVGRVDARRSAEVSHCFLAVGDVLGERPCVLERLVKGVAERRHDLRLDLRGRRQG